MKLIISIGIILMSLFAMAANTLVSQSFACLEGMGGDTPYPGGPKGALVIPAKNGTTDGLFVFCQATGAAHFYSFESLNACRAEVSSYPTFYYVESKITGCPAFKQGFSISTDGRVFYKDKPSLDFEHDYNKTMAKPTPSPCILEDHNAQGPSSDAAIKKRVLDAIENVVKFSKPYVEGLADFERIAGSGNSAAGFGQMRLQQTWEVLDRNRGSLETCKKSENLEFRLAAEAAFSQIPTQGGRRGGGQR